MKILHVINGLSLGGTEQLFLRHLEEVGRSFPEIENRVCVLGSRTAAYPRYLTRLPGDTRFLNYSGRYRDPREATRSILALRRILRAERPDLIHSYKWNADVFMQAARMGTGIPQAAHIVDRRAERNAERLPQRVKTRLTGWLLRRPGSRFPAVSEACRRHAIEQYRLDPADVVTAHNGIPVGEFEVRDRDPARRERLAVGAISNLIEEKGHDFLIEAAALIENSHVPVEVHIAGDGPLRNVLDARIREMGLSDRVRLLGRVPSARRFYSEIDLFVIPSVAAEGLPTTILEAMAAGLPVVATDIGGATEAVRDGIEGLVVPPADPRALAAALSRLLSAPSEMLDMGRRGHARVLGLFSLEGMTRTIVERVYCPLLEAGRPGRPGEVRAGPSSSGSPATQ